VLKKKPSSILKIMSSSDTRIHVLFIVLLLLAAGFIPLSSSQRTNHQSSLHQTSFDGQILFSPVDSTNTYLIDSSGTVTHSWSHDFLPGQAVRWLGDGTLLRSIRTVGLGYGGGAGGGIQIVQWDGTIEWDFRYDSDGNLSHHDVLPLPNGNILRIAWETKSYDEAIAAGRDPEKLSGDKLLPLHIIEVHPTGPTSGDIVWEWHVWDHLIQDFDPSKDNYGVVANHPELVDFNYDVDIMSLVDWLHTNSIDYNPEFDQILLSVHNFNEIWVIDHSTTTEEAAGHSGGNSGKGGDLLYRWGNPESYRAGTSTDQKLFGQHDATWIKPGCPGEGHILVFNNGVNRPNGWYSTVDEIIPPVNESGQYYLAHGEAYGPEIQTWVYNPTPSFVAGILSGAERLSNGNTLICDGVAGRFFIVTPDGTTIWEYTNSYPSPALNNVFKIVYIPPEEQPEPGIPDLDCSGSLSWSDIEPGSTVIGSFQVQNIGNSTSLLDWEINTSSIPWGTWTFTPESGENLRPDDGPTTVLVSVIVPDEAEAYFEGYLQVENQDDRNDSDIIPVILTTPAETHGVHWMFFQNLIHWLQQHSFLHTQGMLRNLLRNHWLFHVTS
jgi:hypothetical protein